MDWQSLVLDVLKLLLSYWGAEQLGEVRQQAKDAETDARATQAAFKGYEDNRALSDDELDARLRADGRSV